MADMLLQFVPALVDRILQSAGAPAALRRRVIAQFDQIGHVDGFVVAADTAQNEKAFFVDPRTVWCVFSFRQTATNSPLNLCARRTMIAVSR